MPVRVPIYEIGIAMSKPNKTEDRKATHDLGLSLGMNGFLCSIHNLKVEVTQVVLHTNGRGGTELV